MIRQPAVEIINYLKNLDLSQPAYRFVLCKLILEKNLNNFDLSVLPLILLKRKLLFKISDNQNDWENV